MAHLTIEQRLEILEGLVADLQQKLAAQQAPPEPWWKRVSGSFKDDPVFDEILEYGRAAREAGRPAEEEVPT
jgi:hypothetical protein